MVITVLTIRLTFKEYLVNQQPIVRSVHLWNYCALEVLIALARQVNRFLVQVVITVPVDQKNPLFVNIQITVLQTPPKSCLVSWAIKLSTLPLRTSVLTMTITVRSVSRELMAITRDASSVDSVPLVSSVQMEQKAPLIISARKARTAQRVLERHRLVLLVPMVTDLEPPRNLIAFHAQQTPSTTWRTRERACPVEVLLYQQRDKHYVLAWVSHDLFSRLMGHAYVC